VLGRRTTPRVFRYGLAVLCAYYTTYFANIVFPVSYSLPWQSWLTIITLRPVVLVWLIQVAGVMAAFFPWRRYTALERLMLIPNTMLVACGVFEIWAAVDSSEGPASNFVGPVGGMLFNLFYAVVIALLLRRVNDERQSLRDEMRSAREVQRRLVPEVTPVPGFHIDAAYLPAKEVGGDFYQLLPGGDGSLLVVVGDVSGKGLDAAMVVAATVGALGDLGSRVPSDVLAHLNRALIGKTRGGFVTCCCDAISCGRGS